MSTHWSGRAEGGGRFAIWLIRGFALRAGRPLTRLALWPITLYFFLRRGDERRASRAFLGRVLGRPARNTEILRHIHRFASTILDRVFLIAGRHGYFDIRVHGAEALTARMRPDRGVLLLGAHVGSFDVLRAAAAGHPDVRIRAVLDVQQTPALTELLHALDPALAGTIIDASRPGVEVVLAMREALAEGALTGLLADRARPHEATLPVRFLGEEAPFPTSPFLVASVLAVPVVLCFGLYRGGNRYDVHFELFAEHLELPRARRGAALAVAMQRYAARLEDYVRVDPYNWFNWHDFWNPDLVAPPASQRLAAGGDAAAAPGRGGA